MYEYARRTREWCSCVVRVDGGAIGSEDFNIMRCTNAQGGREVVVRVRRQGRRRLAGLSTPLLFLSPVPFPVLNTCVWAVPAMVERRDCQIPLYPFPPSIPPSCIRVSVGRVVCRGGLAMIALKGSEIRTMAARRCPTEK